MKSLSATCAAAFALGCSPRIDDVVFVPGQAAGTGTVTFSTRLSGDAHVEAVSASGGTTSTPAVAASAGAVPVLGLRTGERYDLTVVVGDAQTPSEPIEVQVAPPERDAIPLTVTTWDPDAACAPGGYVLFSYIGADSSGIGIIDREARYVFSIGIDPALQVARVRPGRDGASLLYTTSDAAKVDDVAEIVRMGLDGTELSHTRTRWGHHDFVELPEGGFGWLGYDIRPYDVVDDVFGLGEVPVAGEVVYEGPEGLGEGDEPHRVWDSWAGYPQGTYTIPDDSVNRDEDWDDPSGCGDPSLAPPWVPAFLPCAYEFAHGNSLVYRPDTDSYLANWRWLDTTVAVARTGELIWQWGGPFSDLVPAEGTAPFRHAHYSEGWDDHLLVFDNRDREVLSRLVEYTYDDDSFTEVWSLPSDAYENLLGDVRRIPIDGCDHLLVSWSGQGRISEIARDGTLVWDVASPVIGNVTSRVFFVPDLYDLRGVDGD